MQRCSLGYYIRECFLVKGHFSRDQKEVRKHEGGEDIWGLEETKGFRKKGLDDVCFHESKMSKIKLIGKSLADTFRM